MQRFGLPAVIAVAVIIIAGHAILQGSWTERWGRRPISEEQKLFAERINGIPITVGDWDSVEIPADKRQMEAARADNYFSRRFYNRKDQSQFVDITIVSGHPVDVIQHTPDQCYVLSGFKETEEQTRAYVESGKMSSEFSTNRFRKSSSIEGPQDIRILWSFSSDGKWEGPTSPRFSLMHNHALFKLYAIVDVRGNTHTRADEGTAVAFLKEFMPALNAVLFPPEAKAPATPTNAEPAASPAS